MLIYSSTNTYGTMIQRYLSNEVAEDWARYLALKSSPYGFDLDSHEAKLYLIVDRDL